MDSAYYIHNQAPRQVAEKFVVDQVAVVQVEAEEVRSREERTAVAAAVVVVHKFEKMRSGLEVAMLAGLAVRIGLARIVSEWVEARWVDSAEHIG